MSATEDFSSLPITDRLVHKVWPKHILAIEFGILTLTQDTNKSLWLMSLLQTWKVRSGAYEDLAKEIPTLDPNKDQEKFGAYEDYVPKMIKDSKCCCTRKCRIQTILTFVDNAPKPARTRDSVVPVLAEKCLSSPRAGIRNQGS